jgi:hypothetical protein
LVKRDPQREPKRDGYAFRFRVWRTSAFALASFGGQAARPGYACSILVTTNDRSPFARCRALGLSRGAAAALGLVRAGVRLVTAEVVE